MHKTKIAIADDHGVFREALKAILPEEQVEVVLEADNGSLLLEGLKTQHPDIVLLDISMPGLRGVEATEQIRRLYPSIKILVISMYADEIFRTRLLAAGADAYLPKHASPHEIREALAALAASNGDA